jgi:hypothetical protein
MQKVFLVKPVKESAGDAKPRLIRAEKRSQVESYILGDFLIEPVTELVAGQLESVAGIQVEDAE